MIWPDSMALSFSTEIVGGGSESNKPEALESAAKIRAVRDRNRIFCVAVCMMLFFEFFFDSFDSVNNSVY
jgi:hypothetical protein